LREKIKTGVNRACARIAITVMIIVESPVCQVTMATGFCEVAPSIYSSVWN